MVYFYKSSDNSNNVLLYRTNKSQCILKAQKGGRLIPILKCSNVQFAHIFSELNAKHNHIVRLAEHETNNVIEYVLDEKPYRGMFKPSSIMNYRTHFIVNREERYVYLSFEVYFKLWRINPENHEVTEIETEKEVFDYMVSFSEFQNMLTYVVLNNDDLAHDIIIGDKLEEENVDEQG